MKTASMDARHDYIASVLCTKLTMSPPEVEETFLEGDQVGAAKGAAALEKEIEAAFHYVCNLSVFPSTRLCPWFSLSDLLCICSLHRWRSSLQSVGDSVSCSTTKIARQPLMKVIDGAKFTGTMLAVAIAMLCVSTTNCT